MYSNIMEIKFPNKSDNERFARTVAALITHTKICKHLTEY